MKELKQTEVKLVSGGYTPQVSRVIINDILPVGGLAGILTGSIVSTQIIGRVVY